jgi:endonuclease YncB( thermonuclease family)
VVVLAFGAGLSAIISGGRDSAGSLFGGNGSSPARSDGAGATSATVHRAATEAESRPTPTEEPPSQKPRAPRGVPDDAVIGWVVAIDAGDTFEVRVGDRAVVLRLAGIDAPDPDGACYGDEAAARLGELVRVGSPIWVLPDPTTLESLGPFTGNAWTWDLLGRNPRFVNEELVRGGNARYTPPAFDDGYDEPARLLAAQADALAARRGLWGEC